MRPLAISLAAAAIAGIACVWACLPDLEVTPPAAIGPSCGDGVISPDAGEECDPGPDASLAALTACRSSDCAVACVGNLPFVDRASERPSYHCYFAAPTSSPNSTEIDAAGAACEVSGAHVVRFVSEQEVSFVARQPGDAFWIGLRDTGGATWLPTETTTEPGWSAQCPGCFAHIEAGAGGIPVVLDAGGRCVEGNLANGANVPTWTQSACKAVVRRTLCEREPVGTRTVPCAQGACFTVAATQRTKRYILLPGKLDAADAVAHCSVFGGALVVLESREEREQIGYELATQSVEPKVSDFWIGLAASASGAWAWDGDAGGLEPPPWGLSQPPITASARAFVVLQPGAVDSALARAQMAPTESHYAVCELR